MTWSMQGLCCNNVNNDIFSEKPEILENDTTAIRSFEILN